MEDHTTGTTKDTSRRTTLILATACTILSMMQSLVAPLLTVLPPELNTTPGAFTWAVTATLLAGAVFIPIAGRLGDMLGKKRVIVALIVPMVIGCVLSALATSLITMVVGRALQGIALGAIPVSVALLRDVLPVPHQATAIALVSASLGIGGGLALPLAAAFAQFWHWRMLFWTFTGVSVLVLLLVAVFVPTGSGRVRGQRFDLLGAVLLTIGLSALLLVIAQGTSWGWTSVASVSAIVVAAVAVVAWIRWELRTPQPLVDLRSATRPIALLTNVASVFAGMAMYISLVTTPQILQLPTSTGVGLGVSLLAAGLLMLPGGVIQMGLAPVGGRIINARGPKTALIVGLVVIAIGYASSQVLLTSAIGIMLVHVIVKGGVGIAYGAMPTLVMSEASPTESGAANGFNTLMRTVGSSSGSALVGAVFGALTLTIGGEVFISEAGFRVAYLIGLVVAIVAIAVAALIPWRQGGALRKVTPTPAETAAEAG